MSGSSDNDAKLKARALDRKRRRWDADSAAKAWDATRATRDVEVTTPKVPVLGSASDVAECLHPARWSKFITGIEVKPTIQNEPRGTFIETIEFQGAQLRTRVCFNHQMHPSAGGVLRFWWADSLHPEGLLLRDEGIIVARATEVPDVTEIWLRKRLTVPNTDLPVSWAITPQVARALLTQTLMEFASNFALFGKNGRTSPDSEPDAGHAYEAWTETLSGRPEIMWSLL
jgi:hypothetical protein